MTDDYELKERVALGSLFLDQTQPGWRDRIDIIKLDLADPQSCVLGQLWDREQELERTVGPYTRGTWALADWLDESPDDYDDLASVRAGFERDMEDYEVLTRAWVESIGRGE
jgi:hypothetical protein